MHDRIDKICRNLIFQKKSTGNWTQNKNRGSYIVNGANKGKNLELVLSVCIIINVRLYCTHKK